MSGVQVVVAALAIVVAVGIVGWIGYALGHVVGERDEVRRICRYLDGTDVEDAVRSAALADLGLGDKP